MRINDMFTGVILGILSILLFRYAQSLPQLSGLSYGPGTFPSLIACGLFIGSIGLMISGFKDYKNPAALRSDEGNEDTQGIKKSTPFFYALSVPAAIVFYMVVSPIIGFSLSSFVIVGAMVAWLSKRWLLGLIVASCTTAVMWFTFAQVLQVPLPTFSF